MRSTCRSCGAPIVWAVTKNGRPMPVDPDPTAGGNLLLVLDPDPREPPLARHPLTTDVPPFVLHLSHFATCPNAAEHRKVK